MKRMLFSLVPVLAMGWAAAAMAQAPVEAQSQAQPNPAAQHEQDKGEVVERACVRETGTRLRNHARQEYERCLAGRSFDRDDIDRTGEMDLARAIRKLDPSVR